MRQMIGFARYSCNIFLVLSVIAASAPTSAGTLTSFRVNDWRGFAYSDDARKFERCSATKALKGINITYSVDRQFGWSLRLSNPDWTFTKGAETGLILKIDELEPVSGRATALEKDLIEFVSRDQIRFFADLRLARELRVVMGGLVFRLPVFDGSEALSALTQCAIRFSHFPINRNAKIISTDHLDSKARTKEAGALAKLILSYARVSRSQLETVPEDRPDTAPDAAWVLDTLVTTSIKIVDGANQLIKLANDVVSSRHRSCEGGFFFIALPEEVSGLSMGRIYSSCQTADGLSATYDLLVPRPKTGYYVINETTKGSPYILVGFRLLRAYEVNLRSVTPLAVRELTKTNQQPNQDSKADAGPVQKQAEPASEE
jgi:hypothetical protein